MALTELQEQALQLELEKYPAEMTLTDIAKTVGVDVRTLRRWRQSNEYQSARSASDTPEMEHLFKETVRANPANAALWKVYWDRFGGEDDDLAGAILRMTEEDATDLAREAAEWYVEQGGVSAVENLVSLTGPDAVPAATDDHRRGRKG